MTHFEQTPLSHRQRIASLIPQQDEWTLLLVRDEFGYWSFSLPQYDTYDELLCNGTEKAIDWHYKQLTGILPAGGSRMLVTINHGDGELPDYVDTELVWVREDYDTKDSNYYIDVESLIVCWLCPYLQALFKDVPRSLFMRFEPVSSLRTGTRGLADDHHACHNNIVTKETDATQTFDHN